MPLFGPPANPVVPVSKPVPPAIVQPAAAPVVQKVEHRVNSVHLWLPRLRQGFAEEQVHAVREVGKLGVAGADAVPLVAEVLTKGPLVVRREVPDTLAKIGAPAKMATAVLERCLTDHDTDLKVNAARALLELADK